MGTPRSYLPLNEPFNKSGRSRWDILKAVIDEKKISRGDFVRLIQEKYSFGDVQISNFYYGRGKRINPKLWVAAQWAVLEYDSSKRYDGRVDLNVPCLPDGRSRKELLRDVVEESDEMLGYIACRVSVEWQTLYDWLYKNQTARETEWNEVEPVLMELLPPESEQVLSPGQG